MAIKICKHGNSLSIRIGAHIARTVHLKAGDFVNVRLLDNGDIRVRLLGQVVPAEFDSAATVSQCQHESEATEW